MEFTSSLNCFTTNLWFNSFVWQKREGGRIHPLKTFAKVYLCYLTSKQTGGFIMPVYSLANSESSSWSDVLIALKSVF